MHLQVCDSTEEALDVADAMIKENQDKFGVKSTIEASLHPLLQKYLNIDPTARDEKKVKILIMLSLYKTGI